MPERILGNETRYHVMRLLAEDPSLSQRNLARALGVRVGRINYCLKALLERGYVKAANFKNSRNRRGYLHQTAAPEV